MKELRPVCSWMLRISGRILVEWGVLLLVGIAFSCLQSAVLALDFHRASIVSMAVILPGNDARIAESLVEILFFLMLVELQFMYRDYWKGMLGSGKVRVPGWKRERWVLGLLGGMALVIALAVLHNWLLGRTGL